MDGILPQAIAAGRLASKAEERRAVNLGLTLPLKKRVTETRTNDMMAARRREVDLDFDGGRPDAPPLPDFEDFAKILRLRTFEPREAAPSPTPTVRTALPSPGDISAALEAVHQAATSIRASDERIRESETRMHALLQRAAEDLRTAEARAEAAEARAFAAEERAQAAEMRAREDRSRAEEAENWLRQIFATISEELPGRR